MKHINESGGETTKTTKGWAVYAGLAILVIVAVSVFVATHWQNFPGRAFEREPEGWKLTERASVVDRSNTSAAAQRTSVAPTGPNMSVPDPKDRTNIESTQLALSMLKNGGKYLDQATMQDLQRIAFNPWINVAIPDIQDQFARAINWSRKEVLQMALPGTFPDVGTPGAKYEYTASGAILILKSSYLDVAYSSAKNGISDTRSDEDAALMEKSLSEIGSAMESALAGKLADGTVSVISYGKDDKLATKAIQFKRLMDGNFAVTGLSETPVPKKR